MNPLSRIEKETSKLLPTGNLPIPRNSWVREESTNLPCVNSAAGTVLEQLVIYYVDNIIIIKFFY